MVLLDVKQIDAQSGVWLGILGGDHITISCPGCVLFVRVDQAGVICKQEGIFRVNCMDCLDRTNVVQAAVARVVMEQQVGSFYLSGCRQTTK